MQDLSTPDNPLEALLSYLRLCRSNGSSRIWVSESTPILSILELSCLCRADTDTGGISTASRAAIRIGNTTTSDELGSVARAHVGGASVVGRDLGNGHGRDCIVSAVWKTVVTIAAGV